MCGKPIGFQRWVNADNTIGMASKKGEALRIIFLKGGFNKRFNYLFYTPDSTLRVLSLNSHHCLCYTGRHEHMLQNDKHYNAKTRPAYYNLTDLNV